MKLKIRHNYLILIGFVLLLNVIFPPPRMVLPKYSFEEGEIAPYDVIAPYDFFIPKTEQELYEEKQGIIKRIPPVFLLDPSISDLVNKQLNSLEKMIDSLLAAGSIHHDSIASLIQKEYALDRSVLLYLMNHNHNKIFSHIRSVLNELYSHGVVDKQISDARIITIISGDKEMVESIDQLHSLQDAEEAIVKGKPDAYRILSQFFLRPNIIYDQARTNERIDEVFSNVTKTKGKVLKGELIIEKHKRLTREAIEILETLEGTYISIGAWEIVKTLLFRNLLYAALVFLLFRLSLIKRLNILEGKNLYFISLLTAIYIVIGGILHATDVMYLLPVAFFMFLFALYFDLYVAMFFNLIFAALFGVTLSSQAYFLFLFASGTVAIFSTQTINSRLALYRPLIYISLANVITIVFADVYLLKTGLNFVHLVEGVLNSFIGSFCFALLLPLFEKLFDFTTDLTLLELGNLNLPLFKELAMEAPGTYHHSIVAGSLAEAAARAIGSDPILARVGAYYHDIGKLKKPEYFIENQIGVKNPHDSLKPQMSTLVIISHVKDGVEMAKKMKLPRKIMSIIEQHHGTTPIEVFYRKALDDTPDINEDTFRYPGPKPKTKEAAVVMLADSVEAAARSEKNVTVTKLQKILKETIDRKFNDGQLDECPINRQDIELLKTSFLAILTGVFHPRVDYEKDNSKVKYMKRTGKGRMGKKFHERHDIETNG